MEIARPTRIGVGPTDFVSRPSAKCRSALPRVMAYGLRKSLGGATRERPDPRRAAGVGGPHSPARAPARLAAPFRGFATRAGAGPGHAGATCIRADQSARAADRLGARAAPAWLDGVRAVRRAQRTRRSRRPR